jgi:hypothetical protein
MFVASGRAAHHGSIASPPARPPRENEDPDGQTRDVLLGQVFPRRAQVIDTATLRALLSP